ncbi:NAD(P)/FAD-dependent oxidoreductase [Siccirubricoccus sp. KC 17139]|uniref:NAD(P)/FAD-dependent oxidoreductase n=1 Tax=Siccirubricoccus soli TaxID=2899147 RepID=A0ABT1DAT6_9PROT|nr:NAD(P)/FAD-dependent oxidoreductase [Siccirubricoccus soli]MCO6419048.1 NAD(P)/FAD-dependent oxidoreductase [Siccirubricoccus soli]MCP2685183.1 NAD(P)/FAD-dependent oxidoreductase [Siccirubricoccus soli]
MDDFDQALREFHLAHQARCEAADWLGKFEAALASRDPVRIGALFHADSHWRDVLAFTWYMTPVAGRDEIARRLAAEQGRTAAHGLHLPKGRKPPRHVTRLGVDSIEAIFEFSTAEGRGAGIVRLSAAAEGEAKKAWLLSTTLQALTGHEEKIGANRPTGAAYSRNFGGDNWADMRRKAVAYEDRDPAVLVIGGAQAGLSIAARLNQLEVDTLVVEKWPRIGDSWRKRYHSLALHNSIHINHLPYMEFPPTWPTYIPKDMLGNWFEFYADAMEINCWTDTEFVSGAWDEAAKCWTARVRRGDGKERVFRPRHLVFANGVSSYPKIPELPGLKDFKGEIIHSEGFDSGAAWAGKRALILGTGSSANDIALDLHSHGVHTTLIQRGSTTVVSINPSARLNEAVWNEGGALEDNDLIVASATPPLVRKAYQAVVKRMLEFDKEMIEGLKGIGFKHDIGEDETGHQMKYYRRGGGYNLDAGSSALMIKGELGLLQFDAIESFTAGGALLKDGKTVPADLIVLATGYYPQQELVRRALGEEMLERIGPVWGIGPNGELNNMYKRTPQQGLWFIAGGLAQCRINSKYLALQIKAMELGKLGPL